MYYICTYNLYSLKIPLLCLWTGLLHTGYNSLFRARLLTAKAAQDSRGSMQGWRAGFSGTRPGAPDLPHARSWAQPCCLPGPRSRGRSSLCACAERGACAQWASPGNQRRVLINSLGLSGGLLCNTGTASLVFPGAPDVLVRAPEMHGICLESKQLFHMP